MRSYMKFGPVVQEEMPYKGISYLEPSCSILVENIMNNNSVKLF